MLYENVDGLSPLCMQKLYDAYFGPLSHLPGPFLGRFSKYSKASLEKPLGTG